MRKNAFPTILISLLFLLSGAAPLFAQQQSGSQGQKGESYFLASNLVGKNVKNNEGKYLGTINDLIMGNNGKVDYVVIGRGGVWGVGEKNTPVPWKAGNFKVQKNDVLTSLTESKINKAPKLTGGNWSQELAQSGYEHKIHSYYGTGGSK